MPHVELDLAGGCLWVATQWTEKELIKQAPGSRWVSPAQAWSMPLSWGSMVTLRGLFGATLTYSDLVKEWVWAERNERIDVTVAFQHLIALPDEDMSPEAAVIRSWR